VLAGLFGIMQRAFTALYWLVESEIIGAIDDLLWVEEVQVSGRILVFDVFEFASDFVAFLAIGAVEVDGGLNSSREGEPSEDDVLVEHCDENCWMKDLGKCWGSAV
jgi:hypothetical protein